MNFRDPDKIEGLYNSIYESPTFLAEESKRSKKCLTCKQYPCVCDDDDDDDEIIESFDDLLEKKYDRDS
jgi:hypothetical protein